MIFPEQDNRTHYLKRSDPDELLGTFSDHAFKLDGHEWPTAEHYFQAMKFEPTDAEYQSRIQRAPTPAQARKLGRKNGKQLRPDWPKVKRVIMTRALYTKCKAHETVAQALLATNEGKLLEASQYDYEWGCGRDRRGQNLYGEVLMDVRRKLRQEIQQQSQ